MVRHSILALVVASLSLTPASAQPAGLPAHFAFGLSASPGDAWMPQSGIAWDYRFQYLAGGVNTGHGWETWNPNGTFASNYAQESAQHGYIPMFPYYELLQSSGSCGGCDENKKDVTNLNDAALMRAYFSNFALLMKRLGPGTYDGVKGFGGTVLVNVEPDFSGGYAIQAANGRCFGFCSGRGNDPEFLKAAVSSSGQPDVAGLPDTFQGFTQAVAHLRDLYAPNVLLGYDVSPWATGDDIGLDPSPTVEAAALGQQVGAFLARVGPHEVLFNDPLDRDAGQYRAQFAQNRWWDRLNVKFPNFARWEQYLHGAIAADAGKPMLLWQVPIGNQYFQTENNTDGHFQDNRAEYIFGHVPELIETGIVGALFGSGNAGNTTNGDAKHDGVTNPPVLCTSDGISTGQVCNDHPSSVADDDGGFIRTAAQAYYQSPVALGGSAATAPADAPGSPASALVPAPAAASAAGPAAGEPPAAAPGSPASGAASAPLVVALGASAAERGDGASVQDVTLRQDLTVNADATLLVDFELYDAQGQKVWQTFHDNTAFQANSPGSDVAVFTIPDSLPAGQYTFKVGVFPSGWGTPYAWNDQAGTLTIDGN